MSDTKEGNGTGIRSGVSRRFPLGGLGDFVEKIDSFVLVSRSTPVNVSDSNLLLFVEPVFREL